MRDRGKFVVGVAENDTDRSMMSFTTSHSPAIGQSNLNSKVMKQGKRE